jgi:hypothetical protein
MGDRVDVTFLQREMERLKADVRERLRPEAFERGGGGGHTGGMDPWQQSVETRLGQLHTDVGELGAKLTRDFVITWGGIVTLGLLSVVAAWTLYSKVDDRLDQIYEKTVVIEQGLVQSKAGEKPK